MSIAIKNPQELFSDTFITLDKKLLIDSLDNECVKTLHATD